MKVIAKRRINYAGGLYIEGQVFECDEKQAAEWIRFGTVAPAQVTKNDTTEENDAPRGRHRRRDMRADE